MKAPELAFRVVSPKGAAIAAFDNVVDAVSHMRTACPGGSKVLLGKTVLAVRVSPWGTSRGAVKRARSEAEAEEALA